MTLFTRIATTDPHDVGLPPGYSDPESLTYVPEQLRDSWVAIAANDINSWPDMHTEIRALARADAYALASEQLGSSDLNESQSPAARRAASATRETLVREIALANLDTLAVERYDTYRARVLHAYRCDRAHAHAVAAARKEENRIAHRVLHTCPVCGQYDHVNNGAKRWRPLDLTGEYRADSDQPKILSCASCHLVAVIDRAVALGRVVVGSDGRTRLDAAREAASKVRSELIHEAHNAARRSDRADRKVRQSINDRPE